MKEFILKSLKYIGFGILIVPFSIITHELGHFLAYHLFGASNIQLHSLSVSADKDALSNSQIAVANIVGPLITYLTIGLAYFAARKNYHFIWIILALAAPLGRVVNFVYIYFRLAGYDPNPNFDEFNFSKNLDIEPLFPSIFTALLVLAVFVIFFTKAWKENGFSEISRIILSIIVGVSVWSLIGGFILP